MEVLEKGHIYKPQNREIDSGCENQAITFINKEKGREHGGTTTQEVIRILLDRTRHCANYMPHRNNEQIIYHLQMALVLHEARALERKVEKGEYMPEYIATGNDGHFLLTNQALGKLDTTVLIPFRNDWDRPCNHDVNSNIGE